MIESTVVKSSNNVFRLLRTFQKDKKDFAVLFISEWDQRSKYIQDKLSSIPEDQNISLILIDVFETPELFSINDKLFGCTSVPACYFYKYDKRIREYRIFKEILPSRILEGLGVFE